MKQKDMLMLGAGLCGLAVAYLLVRKRASTAANSAAGSSSSYTFAPSAGELGYDVWLGGSAIKAPIDWSRY